MDYNTINKTNAEIAYKKFIKSSKNIFGINLKNKKSLKSFSEIQKEENAYNSISLGIKEVPLDKIVGSVEKYEDFYDNFIPKNNIVKSRWENIYIACINEENLPLVSLYKIKDNYYVYDGNHRISVAKYLNYKFIEAEVKEFLPTNDKKEEILYRESIMFSKETGIDNILFSKPFRYEYIKEEIQKYVGNMWECRKNSIEKESVSKIDFKIEAKKWYKNIFLPSIEIIKSNNILKYYGGNNENDLFYFYLEHKKYLKKNLNKKIGYTYSLVDFINFIKNKNGENIESLFKIFDNVKNIQKLLDEDKKCNQNKDFLIENNGNLNTFKSFENSIWDIFFDKIIVLPERYFKIFESLKITKFELRKYVLKYFKIRYKENLKINLKPDLKDFENIILNYIIEILIPILDQLENFDNKNLKAYEEFQKNYFYLLKLKNQLIIEGKPFKYEIIANKNINFSNSITDVKNILLQEKEEEFLKNLLEEKDKQKYLEICKTYEEVKMYETYVKLFELLDINGEKRFLKKFENILKDNRNSRNLIKYKTEKSFVQMINKNIFKKQEIIDKIILDTIIDDEDFSFIDFCFKEIDKNNQKLYNNEDF